MVTLVAVIAVTVGFGLIAAAVSSGSVTPSSAQGGPPSGAFGNSSPVSTVLTGSNFAVLIVAVLGALIGAREYSSGMIRTTITTVPRRLTVLWAKTVTLVGALLPAALIGVLGAFFAGMAILSNAGAATASLSDTGTARAVFGMVAYIVGIGVMGLAFGFLFRSIATSIATLIGGVMILPTFAGLLLPASWSSLLKYLPANAGEAFTQVTHTSTTLTPAAGAAVFATWVIAAVALAAATLRHRDV
jgi:ABC-type transport system involved in multi-copper enzyme maturation permease subunit